MDRELVEKTAHISHLKLTDGEIEMYGKDLSEILDYFQMLDEAPEADILGFNPVEIADVYREDEPHMDISADELLKDMNTYDGYVRGPRLS